MTKLYQITETCNNGYMSMTLVYSQRALYRQLAFFHSFHKSFSYLSKQLARASRYGSPMAQFTFCNSYARVEIKEVLKHE